MRERYTSRPTIHICVYTFPQSRSFSVVLEKKALDAADGLSLPKVLTSHPEMFLLHRIVANYKYVLRLMRSCLTAFGLQPVKSDLQLDRSLQTFINGC